jgi:Bacterial pre-peptidase C-terminal domain
MLNQSSGQFTTRAADDRPNGARPIGQLNGSQVFRGAVGVKDKNDFYSFTLSGRSSFNLALKKLKNNVDVLLLKDGKVLARSAKGGNKPEAIATTLEAGTYYIRVNQKQGNSKYQLTLNAQADSSSPPPPGKFKIIAYKALLESGLLKVDIGTGQATLLARDADSDGLNDFREVAVFGDQIYVTKGNAVFDVSSDSGIYKVNPNTGALTLIGQTGLTYTTTDGKVLPWSPTALGVTSSGSLYGVYSSDYFYSIDAITGKATFVANLTTKDSNGYRKGVIGLGDIAYDSGTGRFWGAGYRYDEQNGGVSPLRSLVSIGLAGDMQTYSTVANLSGSDALAFENGTLYSYGLSGNIGTQFSLDLNKLLSDPNNPNNIGVETKTLRFEGNNLNVQIVGAG